MFDCLDPRNCHANDIDLSTLVLVLLCGVTILVVWKISNWIEDKFGGDGGRRIKRPPVNPYT